MTHEQLIAICFQWHWNEFPDERQMLYGVNNNVSSGLSPLRQRIEGNKNKAKGVVAGILDFCYILPRYNTCCYLDAKVGKDKLSEQQMDFCDKLTKRGIQWFTFSSLREFQEIIKSLRNDK